MEPQTVVLQRKIVGVLMRAAREKARRTTAQVAQRLGVTPGRIRAYERGARDISLPELELIALYLQTPLSFFLSGETMMIQEEIPQPPTPEEMRTRRALIGAKLKQARLAAGKSKAECAQAIERKAATMGRYERGASDIPITELDTLARFLNVNLYYFVEREASKESADLLDFERLARLPKEVRLFVLDASNLPYLRMAMKFRDLPAQRLQELGEILLVVR
jgi:transcriptional regulator with XRE-family HTH domain